jgi:hypothetical protein
MTVLDALIQSLSRAGEYNRDDQVPPAVILRRYRFVRVSSSHPVCLLPQQMAAKGT